MNTRGLAAKVIRRREYARLQRKFEIKPAEASREILDDTWRGSTGGAKLDDVLPYWKTLLERAGPQDTSEYPPPEAIHWELIHPISQDEVRRALRGTSGCPGPDGWRWRDLKKIPHHRLASLFDLWLKAGVAPSALKRGVTTLLPKEAGTGDPAKFRPITVTGCLVRLFHRILARRFDRSINISEMQRGFRTGDGLGMNMALLQAIVRERTDPVRPLPLALCFVDVRKAFDSVSHDSIKKALVKSGAPRHLVNYIENLYSESSTQIHMDGRLSDPIHVRRGVKQGDPLSCFLFNLVLDQCLEKLGHTNGVELSDGVKVNHLAFADDVVLLAESPQLLQRLLDEYVEALKGVGLEMNAAKCATLNIVVHKRKTGRRWIVRAGQMASVGDENIPALSAEASYRYLGVSLGSGRRRDRKALQENVTTGLEKGLIRIDRAPLKPQQRLFVLREHLIPRLTHQLVLGHPTRSLLGRLDVLVRRFVAKWLHLPHATPKAYYHATIEQGGLGVLSWLRRIPPLAERRRRGLIEHGGSAAAQWLLYKSRWGGEFFSSLRAENRTTQGRGRPGSPANEPVEIDSTQQTRSLSEEFHCTPGGAGFAYHSLCPKVHKWILTGGRWIEGRDYVRCIQLRADLLPTPVRLRRTDESRSAECDYCGAGVSASLAHILQSCGRTHGRRIDRHNYVAKYVSVVLERTGNSVLWEPRIPFGSTVRKPDLIAWCQNQAWVIDVTITGDGWHPDRAHQDKVAYYSPPSILDWVRRRTGCTSVSVTSVTLNWRGALSPESAGSLYALGFSDRDCEILSLRTLTGGHAIWRMWGACTGRGLESRINN